MRFRPRSRPSGLNHSCCVWAPPPSPPAPMEMAGRFEGERDIGVGGGGFEARADAEVGVDGADGLEEGGVVGEPASRAGADFVDLGGDFAARGALIFGFLGAFDGGVQDRDQFVQAFVAFGADINFRAGLGGDGVDAGTAFDDADVGGDTRGLRKARVGKSGNGARAGHGWGCRRRNRSSYGRRGR